MLIVYFVLFVDFLCYILCFFFFDGLQVYVVDGIQFFKDIVNFKVREAVVIDEKGEIVNYESIISDLSCVVFNVRY